MTTASVASRHAEKKHLRADFLEKRSRLAFEEVFRKSSDIQKRFISTPEFKSARKIALYSSFRNEAVTDDIFFTAVKAGKEVYFPRVVKTGGKGGGEPAHLAFFRVTAKEELTPGSYDILEPPAGGKEAKPAEFDCAVIPGVVFDLSGMRIGYGRGYYDRVFSGAGFPLPRSIATGSGGATKCVKVALAFDFQVLSSRLPHSSWDVRVDFIVTEKRIVMSAGACIKE